MTLNISSIMSLKDQTSNIELSRVFQYVVNQSFSNWGNWITVFSLDYKICTFSRRKRRGKIVLNTVAISLDLCIPPDDFHSRPLYICIIFHTIHTRTITLRARYFVRLDYKHAICIFRLVVVPL